MLFKKESYEQTYLIYQILSARCSDNLFFWIPADGIFAFFCINYKYHPQRIIFALHKCSLKIFKWRTRGERDIFKNALLNIYHMVRHRNRSNKNDKSFGLFSSNTQTFISFAIFNGYRVCVQHHVCYRKHVITTLQILYALTHSRKNVEKCQPSLYRERFDRRVEMKYKSIHHINLAWNHNSEKFTLDLANCPRMNNGHYPQSSIPLVFIGLNVAHKLQLTYISSLPTIKNNCIL